MKDYLKNPIIVFFAGLLAIWLLFNFMKVVVNLFWLVVLAFVVLFAFNERFRRLVQRFFTAMFR
ncbi:MAG: hypothetical protein R2792_02810 [Saprospiraceae bacterium]|jgi:hypothetical protein